jgi:Helix-turn-helix domain
MATRVSLAELASAGFALHSAEAAAIVLEICHQHARGELRGIPSAHVIRLTADGRVVAEGPITTDQPAITRAAQLLDDLLPLHVPGGLRLVIARALRTLDLPPFSSFEEFMAALQRFAAGDLVATARNLYQSWERARAPRELTISDLRRARRATGLSLNAISAAAGVSVPLLRELEWGFFRNWRHDAEGRAQLTRYARAAGLDEQLVISIAWPMVEEAMHELAPAPQPAPKPEPEVVEGIVLAHNMLPMPVASTSLASKRPLSVWALLSAAAVLLVAGLTLTFGQPRRPALEAARVPEYVDTAPAFTNAPVGSPAMGVVSPMKREPVVRAVQTRPWKVTSPKPPVKRAAAPKKPASKPNFFKRALLRIVIR